MKGWARPGRCVTGTRMQPGQSSGGPAFLPGLSPTFTKSIPLPAPLPQTLPDPGQVRKNPPSLTPSHDLSPPHLSSTSIRHAFSASAWLPFGLGGPLLWGRAVRGSLFGRIPGFYPLDAGSTSTSLVTS